MARRTIIAGSHYRGIPIQTAKSNDNGSIKEILDAFYERLRYMTDKHVQVSVMHLVITSPQGIYKQLANMAIGRSINALKKSMNNNGIEVQIGWVREIKDSEHQRPHFHVWIIANGKKTQSAVKHAQHLDRLWCKHTGNSKLSGYVHYCSPDPGRDEQNLCTASSTTVIKIRRDIEHADKQFNNAFNWLSYGCKNVEKDNGPYRGRCFAFTQIPRKTTTQERHPYSGEQS